MGRAHAILSASSAKRWMTCTPSARLEEEHRKTHGEETSPYAEEGTRAHAAAEAVLSSLLFESGDVPVFDNDEMARAVEDYTDRVMEFVNEARATTPDAFIALEERLDFSAWVPQGFGTGDVVIISDDVLYVIDLKYGKGVPVNAVGNPQIRLYGLGAWAKFGQLFDFSKVCLVIIQPRLDSISVEEMTVRELLDWGDEVVLPAAEKAFAGEGECVAGDHCKFCKVHATCRAHAELLLQVARSEFAAPYLLTDDEIDVWLAKLPTIKDWIKAVEDYALGRALGGHSWSEMKLVEGRSTRKITDEKEALRRLTQAGFMKENVVTQKLKGLTELEKLCGKKEFAELMEGLIEKPAGAPTLAKLDDRRPAITSAQMDFKEE